MFIFYIICFFCFLEGCEEKREMGLSYKEVGTEVFQDGLDQTVEGKKTRFVRD